ncbi:MAG: hypothetical protein NT068_01525 [Candidatus Nomurabacteria bacterium]|nr:hypothetical protein [Candidatus Nomurabacteria bacterium]
MKKISTIQSVKVLFVAVMLVFSIGASAQNNYSFLPPAPPGVPSVSNNALGPINVGQAAQTKSGPLGIGGNFSVGSGTPGVGNQTVQIYPLGLVGGTGANRLLCIGPTGILTTSACTGGTTMPAGTDYYTLRYDGTNGVWVQTPNIKVYPNNLVDINFGNTGTTRIGNSTGGVTIYGNNANINNGTGGAVNIGGAGSTTAISGTQLQLNSNGTGSTSVGNTTGTTTFYGPLKISNFNNKKLCTDPTGIIIDCPSVSGIANGLPGGGLPTGTNWQTMRYNAGHWEGSDTIVEDNGSASIGASNLTRNFNVYGNSNLLGNTTVGPASVTGAASNLIVNGRTYLGSVGGSDAVTIRGAQGSNANLVIQALADGVTGTGRVLCVTDTGLLLPAGALGTSGCTTFSGQIMPTGTAAGNTLYWVPTVGQVAGHWAESSLLTIPNSAPTGNTTGDMVQTLALRVNNTDATKPSISANNTLGVNGQGILLLGGKFNASGTSSQSAVRVMDNFLAPNISAYQTNGQGANIPAHTTIANTVFLPTTINNTPQTKSLCMNDTTGQLGPCTGSLVPTSTAQEGDLLQWDNVQSAWVATGHGNNTEGETLKWVLPVGAVPGHWNRSTNITDHNATGSNLVTIGKAGNIPQTNLTVMGQETLMNTTANTGTYATDTLCLTNLNQIIKCPPQPHSTTPYINSTAGNGAYTVPPLVHSINIQAYGAGGGGGSGSGSYWNGVYNGAVTAGSSGAGGGSGAEVNVSNVAVNPGDIIYFTVGAKGLGKTGGTSSTSSGSVTSGLTGDDGGDTTVTVGGFAYVAGGGNGGTGGHSNGAIALGGIGGTITGPGSVGNSGGNGGAGYGAAGNGPSAQFGSVVLQTCVSNGSVCTSGPFNNLNSLTSYIGLVGNGTSANGYSSSSNSYGNGGGGGGADHSYNFSTGGTNVVPMVGHGGSSGDGTNGAVIITY